MGAMDFLNAVVKGKHAMSQVYNLYGDGPDGGKADFIKDTVNKFRAWAKDQLLDEFPDLEIDVQKKAAQIRSMKLNVQ
jgi:hypothetical protein